LTLPRFSFCLLILFCLASALSLQARALQAAPAGPGPAAKSAQPSAEATEQETGEDVYRHSASVKLIGRWLHLDKEAAARLFEYLNFAILAGAVLFALLKYLPKTFRAQREDIQHRLVEARTATEQANQRLAAIEQRLSRLDEEVAAIMEAVSRDIAAASSSAQRDLKRFVAGLAVDRAAQRIALTEDDDRALVQEFSKSLSQQIRNGGKN
jgi:F-type H+-transporting ATPase subunit b